jgi:hypothetical protein
MENGITTTIRDSDRALTISLYQQLLKSWNAKKANKFADLFTKEGNMLALMEARRKVNSKFLSTSMACSTIIRPEHS